MDAGVLNSPSRTHSANTSVLTITLHEAHGCDYRALSLLQVNSGLDPFREQTITTDLYRGGWWFEHFAFGALLHHSVLLHHHNFISNGAHGGQIVWFWWE